MRSGRRLPPPLPPHPQEPALPFFNSSIPSTPSGSRIRETPKISKQSALPDPPPTVNQVHLHAKKEDIIGTSLLTRPCLSAAFHAASHQTCDPIFPFLPQQAPSTSILRSPPSPQAARKESATSDRTSRMHHSTRVPGSCPCLSGPRAMRDRLQKRQ
jgi:hypothetical protein